MPEFIKKAIYIIVILFVSMYFYRKYRYVTLGDGVFAPNEPIQTDITDPRLIDFNEYIITPLKNYEIEAKVLSKESYSMDRGADLSPVDFALGWGRMSDENVLNKLSISQSGRWYKWRTSDYPIPRSEIQSHSANVHIIPKDKIVKKMINNVIEGQIVKLKGKLVKVNAKKDSWHWVSSLSRSDIGNGACEVFYVEDVDIVKAK